MAVPNTLADLSTSAASNFPQGGENPNLLDDNIRAVGAILKQAHSKGADLAAATTTVLGTDGNHFDVIGAASIAALSNAWNGRRISLRFLSALTLVHSSNFILPGSVNLVVTANDTAQFVQENTNIWRMIGYVKSTQRIDNLVSLSSFSSNFNVAGTGFYYKFPNPGNGGLIAQGSQHAFAVFDGVLTFSFPTPFDNACRGIFATEQETSLSAGNALKHARAKIVSNSTFTLERESPGSNNSYFVLAFGY